jgi:phosphoribosylaminoimidazolecarboxamide formyltransferase/IMP cyclohydrolase
MKKRALISVSDKTGIAEFATFLSQNNYEIISTGGTKKFLAEKGLKVIDISEVTGFPEIMDGRVKTLHPKVHGALLGVRDNAEHQAAAATHNIENIDMVIVNLYPFEETVAKGAEFDECIENIDIGGPSMIRSAAKNFKFVTIIVNPERYNEVQENITQNNGETSFDLRKKLAQEAYSRTANYDAAISNWFAAQNNDATPKYFSYSGVLKQSLRYGENPHQSAALYATTNDENTIANAIQLHGKELSFNNIADTDAALDLVIEFDEPAAAIIKHANPCGVATGKNLLDAYRKAFACDSTSAFGGIFAFNKTVDVETAKVVSEIFSEVIIAPDYDLEAMQILKSKKNLRIIKVAKSPAKDRKDVMVKTVSGGFLVQNRDNMVLDEAALKVVTKRAPTAEEMKDLKFAFTICKHVKSNAIIYAKDNATIGIGAGQMSRIDSSRIGAWKAKEAAKEIRNFDNIVVASDAFFPFADGLIAASEAFKDLSSKGVTAVIQPGGSIRDDEVIQAADERDIAMIFTGVRHFRH